MKDEVIYNGPDEAIEVKKAQAYGTLYLQKKGAEDKIRITGIFKKKSKAGVVYYQGKDTAGNRFILFVNEPREDNV